MTRQQPDPASRHAWRVIEAELKRRGWSVAQLARHVDLNEKTIRRLKRGLRVEPATKVKIAAELKIPYTTLVPVEALEDGYVSQLEKISEQIADMSLILQAIAVQQGIGPKELAQGVLRRELADSVRRTRNSSGSKAADSTSPRGSDRSQPGHG
jgi:transcriptional regulator with XRE-family HTH domain